MSLSGPVVIVDEVVVAIGLGIIIVAVNAKVELDVEANVCIDYNLFVTVSK